MRLLVINPNTSEEMTRDIGEAARRYARPGTEIEAVSPEWGPRSIEGHYEDIRRRGRHRSRSSATAPPTSTRSMIACYGDPGLAAAREISPVPGRRDRRGLDADGLHRRPLVLDRHRARAREADARGRRAAARARAPLRLDPHDAALGARLRARPVVGGTRDRRRPPLAAIAEDGAEAICLGCAGMGPLDKIVQAEIGIPVLDGTACAVKLLEGILDYGITTSRVAAYKAPEPKEYVNYPGPGVPA